MLIILYKKIVQGNAIIRKTYIRKRFVRKFLLYKITILSFKFIFLALEKNNMVAKLKS